MDRLVVFTRWRLYGPHPDPIYILSTQTSLLSPDGISIGSAVLCGAHQCDNEHTQTLRHYSTSPSLALLAVLAMRANND